LIAFALRFQSGDVGFELGLIEDQQQLSRLHGLPGLDQDPLNASAGLGREFDLIGGLEGADGIDALHEHLRRQGSGFDLLRRSS